MSEEAFTGCLLGTAVGDALGLPYEGLSTHRAAKLFPNTSKHHFLFGKGMVSDDTEHACFVAQAIIRSNGDVDKFQKQLARSLRWWLLALPAGVGFATARATLKLWLGFSPKNSGVFSAGNGPAMRSPILGVAFGRHRERLKEYVRASTEITHSDPKAYYAALAVAIASTNGAPADDTRWQDDYLQSLQLFMPEESSKQFHELARQAAESAAKGESASKFAAVIGSKDGISGYSYHTVPCVLQVWFRFGNKFEHGLQELIEAGGDTDTAGAIFGGIVGARTGTAAIPEEWISNIFEWPRSVGWMARLAKATAQALDDDSLKKAGPRYFWPGVLIRNLVFLIVVLAHGLRRLFPPY
jgi:ADP-ribosyl-[dinitrogen reductase] hydrolase